MNQVVLIYKSVRIDAGSGVGLLARSAPVD